MTNAAQEHNIHKHHICHTHSLYKQIVDRHIYIYNYSYILLCSQYIYINYCQLEIYIIKIEYFIGNYVSEDYTIYTRVLFLLKNLILICEYTHSLCIY